MADGTGFLVVLVTLLVTLAVWLLVEFVGWF